MTRTWTTAGGARADEVLHGRCNCFLVVGDAAPLLVDPGRRRSPPALRAGLAEAGVVSGQPLLVRRPAKMQVAANHALTESDIFSGEGPAVRSDDELSGESAAEADVVADRHSLVLIGLAAVWLACLIFAVMRLAVTLRTGLLTPWWGNAAGLAAITALYLWYRRAPQTRSSGAAHGTALVATVALLLPMAYGMTSTIWWLSLVGFAMVLLGRRREAEIWGLAIPLLVAASVMAAPYVQLPAAAGEPFLEAAAAKIVFVVILIAMAVGFRRVAEQRAAALYDSQQRYRMLFQGVPVGVFHCGQDLRITDCNRQFERIVGGGKPLVGVELHSLRDQRLLPSIRAALAGDAGGYDGPYRAAAASGEAFLSMRTVPLQGRDAVVGGTLGLVEDVTDRIRTQRELHDLKNEFQARALSGEDLAARRLESLKQVNSTLRAIRNINQLITREKDALPLIRQATEMLVEARGYRRAWIALTHADGHASTVASSGECQAFAAVAEEMRKGGWPPCRDLALASEDGLAVIDSPAPCQECPLCGAGETRVVAALRHGTTTHGLLGLAVPADFSLDRDLAREVAEDLGFALHSIEIERMRREDEEALRQSEERFRILFEHAADSILLLEIPPAGVPLIRGANSASLRVLGYQPAELIGQPVTFIDAASDAAAVVKARRLRAQRAGEGMFEVRHRCHDGTVRDFECMVAEMKVGNQRLAISIERDVTERKRAEAEREMLRAGMAQSDRLANMGMLAAGVAHEINNPLSYILYNLQSLTEDLPKLAELMVRCYREVAARAGAEGVADALDDTDRLFEPATVEDALARLRDALAGAERIRGITRSLGTFSRVEHVAVGPVDLRTCVEHAVTMVHNEIKYRARLVKDLAAVPDVLASDGKLAQVVLNLLINAAHAIEEGDAEHNEVRVRTWSEAECVFAEVSDTGEGIAPEHRASVFEPFFTTKGVGVGTGLGLWICKSIIDEFGGTISFTSEVGKGTAFRVRLPPVPRDWVPGDANAPEPTFTGSAARGRILVVDDEEGIRAAIVRILGREHEVVTAPSGKRGRELLERDERFDVIFCDLMMPEMSGMELHAWLAGRNPSLAAQVVFITGGAFTPGAAEYLAQVGNVRLEKPLDAAALRKLASQTVLAARSQRSS